MKAPHVITSVDVCTATADDTEFLTPSADAAINIANACGHEVDTIEGDGGYSGIDQRKNMEDKGLTLVTTELKECGVNGGSQKSSGLDEILG